MQQYSYEKRYKDESSFGKSYGKESFGHTLFESNSSLEQGIISGLYFQKFKLISMVCVCHNMISIFCVITYYEWINKGFQQDKQESLLLVILLDTIVLVLCIYLRNYLYFKYLQARKLVNKQYKFWLSGRTFWTFQNILQVVMIPTSYYHGMVLENTNYETGITFNFRVNDVFVMMAMVRLVPIGIGLINNCEYNNIRIHRQNRILGSKMNVLGVAKIFFKNKPSTVLVFQFLSSVFFFSFALRVCEQPLSQIDLVFDYENYATMYWFTIVTMTTVGYGDFFPRTIPGRIFAFVLCIWGVFYLGLLIVELTDRMVLSAEESKVLTFYEKLKYKELHRKSAAELICNLAKIKMSMKNEQSQKQSWYSSKLYESLKKVKSLRLAYNNCESEESGFYDSIAENVNKLRYNMEALSWRQEKLLSYANFVMVALGENPFELKDCRFIHSKTLKDGKKDKSQNKRNSSNNQQDRQQTLGESPSKKVPLQQLLRRKTFLRKGTQGMANSDKNINRSDIYGKAPNNNDLSSMGSSTIYNGSTRKIVPIDNDGLQRQISTLNNQDSNSQRRLNPYANRKGSSFMDPQGGLQKMKTNKIAPVNNSSRLTTDINNFTRDEGQQFHQKKLMIIKNTLQLYMKSLFDYAYRV